MKKSVDNSARVLVRAEVGYVSITMQIGKKKPVIKTFSISEYIDFTASGTLAQNIGDLLDKNFKDIPKRIVIVTPYIFGTKDDNS